MLLSYLQIDTAVLTSHNCVIISQCLSCGTQMLIMVCALQVLQRLEHDQCQPVVLLVISESCVWERMFGGCCRALNVTPQPGCTWDLTKSRVMWLVTCAWSRVTWGMTWSRDWSREWLVWRWVTCLIRWLIRWLGYLIIRLDKDDRCYLILD